MSLIAQIGFAMLGTVAAREVRHKLVLMCGAMWLMIPVTATAAADRPGRASGASRFAAPHEFFDGVFGPSQKANQDALADVEISIQQESRLGKAAAEAYLASLKRQGIRVTTRGPDVDYLTRLVDGLRPQMQNAKRYPSIRIVLAESPRTDARSFPGGTLILFSGLLEMCESEAALVGVLGHELSHLDHGHQLRQARTFELAQQTFSGRRGPVTAENFFVAGRAMMGLWTQPFRPQDEAQADRDGAVWSYRAGYDPRELAQLFQRLERRRRGQAADVPGFLLTHPRDGDRRRAILAVYRKLSRTEPQERLYVGRENLRRRLTKAQREFAE